MLTDDENQYPYYRASCTQHKQKSRLHQVNTHTSHRNGHFNQSKLNHAVLFPFTLSKKLK